MAGQPLVVVSSAKAAHDLLAVRGARYSDRPRKVVAFELACRGLHLLFRPYDAAYRAHQRMEAPLLHARAAAAYQPVQDLESRQLLTMDWFVVAWLAHGAAWVPRTQKLLDRVVGFERLPAFSDRPRLPYIDAILHEVMRWRPSMPAGVPHFTKQSDEYMGYRIPAGSVVLPNSYAIGRDEGVFGPDTDSFIPERWLLEADKADPGSEAEAGDGAGTGIKKLPDPVFGFGRRVCTGQHMARNSPRF